MGFKFGVPTWTACDLGQSKEVSLAIRIRIRVRVARKKRSGPCSGKWPRLSLHDGRRKSPEDIAAGRPHEPASTTIPSLDLESGFSLKPVEQNVES